MPTRLVIIPESGIRGSVGLDDGTTTRIGLSFASNNLVATLLSNAVSLANLNTVNSPTTGDALKYNGTALEWGAGGSSYTDEQAQDAVAAALTNSSEITWSYNDASNQITASLATTTVSAASYGSASAVATFSVDSKGRLTAAASTNIAIAASQVTSGTFDNARIAQSNVTQHQAALTILESQITDGAILARVGGNETITGSWSFSSSPSVPAPSNGNHAVNQSYVDARIAGQNPNKLSVRAVATTNINLASMPSSIDGVTLASTNRFAAVGQSTGSQNGIYVFNGAGVAATRADDANTSEEMQPGTTFWVNEGTVNADTGWTLITNAPITLDTTALTFTQTSGLGQVVAGAGLTKTGNTLDVGTASSARIVVNADNIDLATTAVSAAAYGSASSVATFTVDAYGRLTAAASTTISVTSTNVSNFNEAAQDAVGTILTNTTTINFTYNDAGNTISAAVNASSLTTNLFSATNSPSAGWLLSSGGTNQITYVDPATLGNPSLTIPASENLAARDFVNIFNDGGTLRVRKANATNDTRPADGFVLAAVTSGNNATVFTKFGRITGLSGLTLGARYYLSTSAGLSTATAPITTGNIVQLLGKAVSATELDVLINDYIVL